MKPRRSRLPVVVLGGLLLCGLARVLFGALFVTVNIGRYPDGTKGQPAALKRLASEIISHPHARSFVIRYQLPLAEGRLEYQPREKVVRLREGPSEREGSSETKSDRDEQCLGVEPVDVLIAAQSLPTTGPHHPPGILEALNKAYFERQLVGLELSKSPSAANILPH